MKFTDILDRYGIKYETEGRYCRPGWIQMRCCFCGGGRDPNKPYLGYNLEGNYANCWICGHHRPFELLRMLVKDEHPKTILDLVNSLSPTKTFVWDRITQGQKVKEPKGAGGPLLGCHIKYLHQRGFTDIQKLFDLWRISGIGLDGRSLKFRIFIPIYYHGEVVSWTTRSISDDVPDRYRSANPEQENIPHKQLLYGEDYCRHAVVVHEGPLDVWTTGPGAVATFGTSFTPEQVLKLSKYPQRVICFDNEPQAQMRARLLCDALECFEGETFNVKLDSKDACEATPKERAYLRSFLEN